MNNQLLDGVVQELVRDSVAAQVNNAVLKALKTLNFKEIVSDHLSKSLQNYSFPPRSIKAESIDFIGFNDPYETPGIEDRSNNIQLTILDDTVVVEDSLVATNITLQNNIDVAGRAKAKNLSVTESALFHQDALVLGKLTTQGENEFKGPAKFLNGIDVTFNDGQIPHGAINFTGFKVDQSQVHPGKIKSFESDGIQDNATGTQLTISDKVVNVHQTLQTENIESQRLTVSGTGNFISVDTRSITAESLVVDEAQVSTNINVLGNVTVAQDLDVKGNIKLPESIKDDLVEYMSTKVKLESIIPEGGSLTIGKRVVLEEQALGNTVINSNLRTVGTLRELVVSGETSLASSVYFSPLGRIGINTDEPTMPIDIWDEGVQVTLGRSKAKTGWVGTGRGHDLELGVNRDPKITITEDSTVIKNPVLDDRRFTQGPNIPGIDGSMGDIHWNTQPQIGQPVGWVCLGRTRWAKFGEIE